MKKILLTGSCGFIGSNFIRKAISENWQYNFVSIDIVKDSYNLPNIKINQDHKFYMADICDDLSVDNIFNIEKPDYLIHMAALSFVDASIKNAASFVSSNVLGTQILIDKCIKYGIEKFIYISTDEVYGSLWSKDDIAWTELSPTAPRNPYSASKLAGELLVKAANQTHNLQYNITRSSNNYGGFQPPRNLVPRIITSLLLYKEIPIQGNGLQCREWIHTSDKALAIKTVLEKGKINETYNIGSGWECANLEMVDKISKMMNKNPKYKFVLDRPGHDQRYFINCDKLKNLGWKPMLTFEEGMQKTIEWYENNKWYYEFI